MSSNSIPDPSNHSSTGHKSAVSGNPNPTSHKNSLAINTSSREGQELQDNSIVPWSPNQLQGIIVERLRSPVRTNDERMFAPEDSCEQRGVPWMLYRSRSHSTGALPYTTGNISTSSPSGNSVDGNVLRRTFSKGLGGHSTVNANSSLEYLAKIAKITREDDNDSVVLPSSLKATKYIEAEDSDQYESCSDDGIASKSTSDNGSVRKTQGYRRSVYRNSSNRTGGKSQFSYYRGRTQDSVQHQNFQAERNGYDELAAVTSRIRSKSYSGENPSTLLYINTDNLETDNTALPQPSSNTDFQKNHLARDMYTSEAMICSGPSSTYCSDTVRSPGSSIMSPHSTHSSTTMTSTSSTILSDLSLYSGLSRESSQRSEHSETSTSAQMCENPTCCAFYNDGNMNEKGYIHVDDRNTQQQQQHHYQQQQRQQNHFEQDNQMCPNRKKWSISKAVYPAINFVASYFSYSDGSSATRIRKRSSNTKKCKNSTQHPKLTSSLYYISGLDDLKRAKKKAGKWSKNSYVSSGPDSKAFFSNERTYMHWIKFGLLLGSMALTLLNFGKVDGLTGDRPAGVYVGLALVMVAMGTLVYGTVLFHRRHQWMINLRHDVRFYDRVGPTVLFFALFSAFATNVFLTMNKVFDEHNNNLYINGLFETHS